MVQERLKNELLQVVKQGGKKLSGKASQKLGATVWVTNAGSSFKH